VWNGGDVNKFAFMSSRIRKGDIQIQIKILVRIPRSDGCKAQSLLYIQRNVECCKQYIPLNIC